LLVGSRFIAALKQVRLGRHRIALESDWPNHENG